MYWPRLRLTKKEATRWAPYFEPDKLQRAVIYRIYYGELNLSVSVKEDTENIQISRRSRVAALTASGDVHNTEVQIYDSGGEQYTMGFTPLSNMLMGTNIDPRGLATWNSNLNDYFVGRRLAHSSVYALPFCLAPHVFEPNIVLDPNQTLSIKGRNMYSLLNPSTPQEANEGRSHVSFNLHVWEFPIE